jgi:hypothetical protein
MYKALRFWDGINGHAWPDAVQNVAGDLDVAFETIKATPDSMQRSQEYRRRSKYAECLHSHKWIVVSTMRWSGILSGQY